MKQVNFKKVTVQNFLSIGNDPVEIDFKTGVNFITGFNKDKADRRNGVGKSALSESIYWCLFGELVRGDLKNDEIVNNITKKNCLVKLDFETNFNDEINQYTIIRGLKPGKLELFKNGEQVTLSSKANTTEYISEIINASPEMFMNCFIMSLNNTIPFMAKSKIEKRKFIEQIFNLDFFNKMLLSIRDDFNKEKQKYDLIESVIKEKENIINHNNNASKEFENNIQIEKNNLKEKESNILDKIKNINLDIDNIMKKDNKKNINDIKNKINILKNQQFCIKKEISSINEKIIDNQEFIKTKQDYLKNIHIDELQIKYNKLNKTISSFNFTIDNIDNQIKQLSKFKRGDQCPTCKNVIDGKNYENIQNLIKQYQNEKDNLLNKIDKLKNVLLMIDYTNQEKTYKQIKEDIELFQNNIIKNNNDLNIKNNKIFELEQNINQYNNDIEKIKNESEKISLYIDNNKKQINLLNEQLNDIKNQYNNIDKKENPFIELNKKLNNELKEQQKNKEISYNNLKLYDVAKFIVSEEGIKSYIIKQVIDIFNNKILYYLNKFESNCIVKFDEMFEVIITNEKGDECSYFNFSGAERKGIDLACLFTFMDMRLLLHGISYNVNMYDELLDTSLDEKGVELVINEIKERVEKYNEASYIISHRKESLNYATGDIIILEKENGITRKLKNV